MRRSRISRKAEQKSMKTLIMAILGIVIVIVLLFKIGIPLLINFSLFVAGHKDASTTASSQDKNVFVEPPVLNVMPSATNSATVIVTGKSQTNLTVKLYVNDSFSDSTKTDTDGGFSFQNVALQNGSNTITVKAVTNTQKESNFSDALTITYKQGKITLSVDSPSDNQSFSKDNKTASVTGKTDPGNRVTVNGFWAIVDDNGNYTYTLQLQNGDNQIKAVATDVTGSTTEIDKKVTYSP